MRKRSSPSSARQSRLPSVSSPRTPPHGRYSPCCPRRSPPPACTSSRTTQPRDARPVLRLRHTSAVPADAVEGVVVPPEDIAQIYLDSAGGYRFRVLARNGEIIAEGESYVRKQDAVDVLEL